MNLNKQQQKIFDSLNDKQKDVFIHNITHTPIYSILHGAVRSGKSFLDNILWLCHVASFSGQNKDFIMSGYTIPALYKNVIKDLEEILGSRITLDKNNSFELFGNTMRCFGTNKIDSYKAARGFTSYGHYGNEVNLSHKNSIDEFINRCSGEGARFFWDCNPDNPNHYIMTDYIEKSGETMADGQMLYSEYHFTLTDNTRLPDSYVQSMLNMPEGMRKNRSVYGLWVASEGVIYTNYIPSQHRIEKPKYDIVETWAGVDFGFEHNGVIVVVGRDYDGNVYLLHEVASQHKQIEW